MNIVWNWSRVVCRGVRFWAHYSVSWIRKKKYRKLLHVQTKTSCWTLFVLLSNDRLAVDVATSTQQHVGDTTVRLSNSRYGARKLIRQRTETIMPSSVRSTIVWNNCFRQTALCTAFIRCCTWEKRRKISGDGFHVTSSWWRTLTICGPPCRLLSSIEVWTTIQGLITLPLESLFCYDIVSWKCILSEFLT